METNKICLNVICKNEGKIIYRMLSSCARLIDYFVICDQNSTDNTKEEIERFSKDFEINGEVHDIEFHNFAQARNESLQKAYHSENTGYNWILLLDCDQILKYRENFNLTFLKTKLLNDQKIFYYLKQENGGTSYMSCRLIPRSNQTEYRCPTHEYLYLDEKLNKAILMDQFYVHEFPDESNDKTDIVAKKFNRDIKMLTEELEVNKQYTTNKRDYARCLFYVAQSYQGLYQKCVMTNQKLTFESDEYQEKCFKYYNDCIECSESTEQKYMCYFRMADLLYNQILAEARRKQQVNFLFDIPKAESIVALCDKMILENEARLEAYYLAVRTLLMIKRDKIAHIYFKSQPVPKVDKHNRLMPYKYDINTLFANMSTYTHEFALMYLDALIRMKAHPAIDGPPLFEGFRIFERLLLSKSQFDQSQKCLINMGTLNCLPFMKLKGLISKITVDHNIANDRGQRMIYRDKPMENIFNPTIICNTYGTMLLLCRTTNYRLDIIKHGGQPRMIYTVSDEEDKQKRYSISPEHPLLNDYCVIKYDFQNNTIDKIDKDVFKKCPFIEDIRTYVSKPMDNMSTSIKGLEDIRILLENDLPDHLVSNYMTTKYNKMVYNDLVIDIEECANRPQKNWIPLIYDGQVLLLHSFKHYVIPNKLKDENKLKQFVLNDDDKEKYDFDKIKGSTQFYQLPYVFPGLMYDFKHIGYYYGFVHADIPANGRVYYQRMVRFKLEEYCNEIALTNLEISRPFIFENPGIEYLSSWYIDNTVCHLTVGMKDQYFNVYSYDINDLLEQLF